MPSSSREKEAAAEAAAEAEAAGAVVDAARSERKRSQVDYIALRLASQTLSHGASCIPWVQCETCDKAAPPSLY